MSGAGTDAGLLDRELARAHAAGWIIDVYRERLTREGLLGRVIQWSAHVLLLERLDEEYRYDGISAVRPNDITRLRAEDRELRSAAKILARQELVPLPDVALIEISAALTKLSDRFPAVTVHCESLDAGMAFVGQPEDLDDESLLLRAWGTARNADDYRLLLRLSEVTHVAADTRYIRRLRELREVTGA